MAAEKGEGKGLLVCKRGTDRLSPCAARPQAVNVLRKQLHVKLVGPGLPPPPLRSFAEVREKYSCGSRLFANLEALGFPGPSPVQAQAIPALLKGRELLAVAPTGQPTLFAP